jgi:hypothetical protein
MRPSTVWRALVIGLALAAVPSAAGTLALDFQQDDTGNISTNGAWSLGWEFYTNSNVLVTALDFYDDYGNGLTESHDVGIYDSSGNLIVWTTVLPSDDLVGNAPWRAHAVTPVILTAGQYYYIMAETGSENYTWSPTNGWTIPQITFIQGAYISSPVLAFPDTMDAGTSGYFGPSFEAAIPEPSTFGLLAIAFGVAGTLRRKRLLRP